jgi:hypothetical protein
LNEVLNHRAALTAGDGSLAFGLVSRELVPQPFDFSVLVVETDELLFDHFQDARTSFRVGRLEVQHLLDLIEGEPKTLRSSDESQAIYDARVIEPVAARRARRLGQEAESFVITERVNADAALRRDLANLEPNFFH